MIILKDKKKINTKAFSVMELIISIAIISSMVASVTLVLNESIKSSSLAKDQIKAIFLAQEGVEIIRNMRDNNRHADKQAFLALNSNTVNWLYGIAENATDPCYFGNTCMVDATKSFTGNNFLEKCNGGWGSCDFIKIDSVSGLYGYNSSWADTKFKREVQLYQNNANDILITISVKWSRGTSNYDYVFKTSLLNWK